MPVHGLIWCYCLTGRPEKGRALMNELKEKSKSEYVANTFSALSAAYLNDNEEAFEYFEKAFIDKDPILLLLKYVQWVPLHLRQDPRFKNLLDRIGFPERA